MRKRLLILTVAFILAVISLGIFTTKTTYAQCGCSCAMVCSNTCEFSCSGCGIFEWIEVAARCCEGAKKATGDTGPCPEGGAS